MNILITGISGLLGKQLAEEFSENSSVIGIARKELGLFKSSNVKYIINDLEDLNFEELPSSIDAIYYLAQSRKFRDFPEGALDMFKINIELPLKLIDWAVKNKIKKFIYASSGGIYRNPSLPVKEFFQINANDDYGFYLGSKLSAEILLKNYAQYFDTFMLVRPFFIYGKGQEESMLIPRLINNVLKGNPITISDTEGISINPIHVKDAAISFKNMLKLEGKHVVNIAGNEIVSLKKIGELIGSITNKQPVFNYNNKTQNDLIADNTLMLKLLHNPTISLIQGLKETYEYILQNSIQEV